MYSERAIEEAEIPVIGSSFSFSERTVKDLEKRRSDLASSEVIKSVTMGEEPEDKTVLGPIDMEEVDEWSILSKYLITLYT